MLNPETIQLLYWTYPCILLFYNKKTNESVNSLINNKIIRSYKILEYSFILINIQSNFSHIIINKWITTTR